MATPDPTEPISLSDVVGRLQPGRRPWGCAAVLLPHRAGGEVDWGSFGSLLEQTRATGLTAAVNMDTGFVQLLDEATRRRVLRTGSEVLGDGFLAGAFVADEPGDPFDLGRYLEAMTDVADAGGTPVVFPSHGLNGLDPDGWVAAHEAFGRQVDRFVAFELGEMFVPYGRIYPTEAYRGLLQVPSCVGAKHSSLSRRAEWERLRIRDEARPDFSVLTGNDLAIDMVCYGSDYLLGLAAFCPDAFARRDAMWADSDAGFHELNDLLQFLGAFSFRNPVPAYRHDAAMFLHLRGWISSPEVPTEAARRPGSDREVLRQIAERLDGLA